MVASGWIRDGWSPWAALVRLALCGAAGCWLMAVGLAAEEPADPQPSPQAVQVPEVKYRTVYPQLEGPAFSWAYRGLPVENSGAEAESRARIEAALDRVLEEKLDFQENPLGDVAMLLQTVLEVPVIRNHKALEDAGIAPDTPLSGVGHGITVRSFLRRLLRTVDLGFRVGDEAIVITTREDLEVHPELRIYALPYGMGRGLKTDFQSIIDLIQNTVEPPTWDTQGGPGSIRPLGATGEPMLVVSQTSEVQERVEALLATLHARGLGEFGDEAEPRPVSRVHRVGDEQLRSELVEKLVTLANNALAEGQDDEATVEAVGGSIVVRSKSPGFHVRAAQLIEALQGLEMPEGGGFGIPIGGGVGMGGGGGGAGFCWVAREVYGADDSRWLVFRAWMMTEAPVWFRVGYGVHGETVATWIHDKPIAKLLVRMAMDRVVEHRLSTAIAE